MANVTMLGAGLMASGFVGAMLERGDRVTVWNRTIEHARPLEALGARLLAEPASAVADAERIHVSLSDDAAVDAILARIADAIPKNAVVIDHTTVTPKGTARRFSWCQERGVAFLHAPVFMSPKAAREAVGVMLVSGPQATYDRVQPDLARMTTDLWYVGDRPDKAAGLKLMGNCLLIAITAGLTDVFSVARGAGLEPADVLGLFQHFNPATFINMRGAAMARGDFTAAFELTMARKDVRLMEETAADAQADLLILPVIAKRMEELIEQGHGRDDVGVLAAEAVRAHARTH